MLCAICRARYPLPDISTKLQQCSLSTLSKPGPSRLRSLKPVEKANRVPSRSISFGMRRRESLQEPAQEVIIRSPPGPRPPPLEKDELGRKKRWTPTSRRRDPNAPPPPWKTNGPNAIIPTKIDAISKVYGPKTYMGRHFNPREPSHHVFRENMEAALSGDQPDPNAVLDAAVPMLQNQRQYLFDKYTGIVSRILSEHYANTPSDLIELPVIQNSVANVLSVCVVRAASSPGPKTPAPSSPGEIITRKPPTLTAQMAENYASYMIHQALKPVRDAHRLISLLENIEMTAKQLSRLPGTRIGAPMLAAWAILRSLNDKTAVVNYSKTVWPSGESVMAYLETAIRHRGESESGKYHEAVSRLLEEPDPSEINTPRVNDAAAATIDQAEQAHESAQPRKTDGDSLVGTGDQSDLDRRLRRLVSAGSEDAIIALWEQTKPSLREDTPDRNGKLSSFIRAFQSPRFGSYPPSKPSRLDQCTQAAIKLVPRPIPVELYHTLIATRARLSEEEDDTIGIQSQSGTDVVALDTRASVDLSDAKRQAALASLHSTWKSAKADGVRKDLHLYMLYLEGLGRYGDLEGLQKAWNELIGDRECEELYREEETNPSAPFPHTKCLNHMISATLLIPKIGPPVALELFRQASNLESALPCDIVTINTVLRHYARMADVEGMQSLFNLAQRLRLKPDVITYTTLVQGLLRAQQLEMANNVLDVMVKAGLEPSERMCSLLIADLAHTGNNVGLRHAEELLREMKRRGWKTGVPTWTGLISGYFRGGWEQDGWDAVRRMEADRLRLNRTAYNMILRQAGESRISSKSSAPPSSGSSGEQPITMKLFKRMIEDGVTPNSDTYVIMLGPLLKARRVAEAKEVVKEMRKQRFSPDKGALKGLVNRVDNHGR